MYSTSLAIACQFVKYCFSQSPNQRVIEIYQIFQLYSIKLGISLIKTRFAKFGKGHPMLIPIFINLSSSDYTNSTFQLFTTNDFPPKWAIAAKTNYPIDPH